jgi:hypothetical protein
VATLYRVILEAKPDEAPPHVRLRRLLKLAGRGFALRCVEVVKLPDGAPLECVPGTEGGADVGAGRRADEAQG